MNDGVEKTGIIFELGTDAIKLSGTEYGTLAYETKATDGCDETVTIYVLGSDQTAEIGTATGVDQVTGNETTEGTDGAFTEQTSSTQFVTETETTAVDGID